MHAPPRSSRFHFRVVSTLCAGAGFLLLRCSGPQGPAGAQGTQCATGPQGEVGTQGPAGPAGPAGMPGTPGADGGLPSSCLSPCHGFNGIVEQWKTSTHYAAFISNLGSDEVTTWTGPGACGNCHALDALQLRVAGAVGTVADGGVTNVKSGELNYRNPSNNA